MKTSNYYHLTWDSPNPFDKSLLPIMEREVWLYYVYREGQFVGRIKTNPTKEKVETALKSLLGELKGNIEVVLTI